MNGFEKRTEQKKQQVLDAAFELINSNAGIEGVTIEDIARKANVGKTTIFKYFGNKENLIHEVFKNFISKIGDGAKKIVAENKPFEETLIALSQNKINYLKKINKQFYLDMMEFVTKKDNDGLSLILREYTQTSIGLMLDLFHRGRKEGKIDLKYSDEFLLLYFQVLVEGISSPHLYPKLLPYTEEWTEMLIKGLAPGKE